MHTRSMARVLGAALVLLVPFATIARATGAPAPLRAIPVPAYVQNIGPLHPLASSASVSASLVLAPRDASALQAAALATVTPGSASYHHWWTPAAILKAFGPNPATLNTLLSRLRQEGFRGSISGWIANVSAPAAVWQRVFALKLGSVVRSGHTYRVQATPGAEPAWMSPVVLGVDGLTTLPPPAGGTRAAVHRVDALANTALHPTTIPKAFTVTAQNGAFQVTATIPGGTNKPTGQPVHVILTATINGAPALYAGVVSRAVAGSTSSGQAVWWRYTWDAGTIDMPMQAYHPLSAGLAVTVYSSVTNGQPAPGAVSATVTLPTLTWTGSSTVQALDAAQINSVYDASTLVAAGQGGRTPTIGLYEEEPPSTSMTDALATFAQINGLPPATVYTENIGGGTPGAGAGGEETLDLQAVEAAAPGANIVVYSDPNMVNALNAAFEQRTISALSISFGGAGGAWTSQLSSITDSLAAEGIAVIASSGDSGTVTQCQCEPADFPMVTAVGGTDVSVSQNGHAYYTQAWGGTYLSYLPPVLEEYVLTEKAASSGGYSQTQPIPSWQQGFLPNVATGKGVPDVAFLADWNVAGLAMVRRSGATNYVGGGTSLGAPLLAGWAADVVAQMGQSLGYLAPTFYALATADPSAFTQAARGNNGAYQITSQDNSPGTWNPITGLGSPNINLWASFVENGDQLPTPTLNAPASASYGSPVTVSANWPGQPGALFQYWWQDPRDGVWHNSGAYGSGSYSFTPPVPGAFPVLAYATAPGQSTTQTAGVTVHVSTSMPMVSNLVVSYSGSHTESAGATVTFTASATDAGSNPLYQFWVHGPNNVWQIAQNYSPANTFTLLNLSPGSYTIAAYALDQQQVAAAAWNKVYGYATVVNVDSSVSLTVPPTGTVGSSIPLIATATNITNPVYQVWLQSPDGSWTQSGAYVHGNTFTFTPSAAGTYRVVVYAKDPYAPNTSVFAVAAAQTVQVGP